MWWTPNNSSPANMRRRMHIPPSVLWRGAGSASSVNFSPALNALRVGKHSFTSCRGSCVLPHIARMIIAVAPSSAEASRMKSRAKMNMAAARTTHMTN
jgi:hypothetical protein